jgi:hypothetical protein
MQAIKISTHIQNGVITLPVEYHHLNQNVEIIVLGEHLEDNITPLNEVDFKRKKKERLFAALNQLHEIQAFREIENPVQWQREQRNEWE